LRWFRTGRLGFSLAVKTAIDVSFNSVLRPDQGAPVDALLAHDIGLLAATTAIGIAVVAARMIAECGVNVLVLVHRR
jgi:superfamily II DNA or RNA helicase